MRFYTILILLNLILLPSQSQVRIIEGSEIARWYLDADLVIISTLLEKESIHIRSTDTQTKQDYSLKCNFSKDKYFVVIDSILKGYSDRDTITIITPEYFHCEKYKISKNESIDITGNVDTTYEYEVIPYTSEAGYYFRLGEESRNIVFLKSFQKVYETVYVMHGVNNIGLKFLHEVETKGEKIFDDFIAY
jgi:hypothetical protein